MHDWSNVLFLVFSGLTNAIMCYIRAWNSDNDAFVMIKNEHVNSVPGKKNEIGTFEVIYKIL